MMSGRAMTSSTKNNITSIMSSSNNMYRVGDYVYFEIHAGQPYQIRKIEELSRTSSGSQVDVKVQCFYRRRDMPSSLINMADKHYAYLEEEENEIDAFESLDDETKHQLRHRELFLSRQSENVPAQYIRGKCSVHLLSEVESMCSYLNNDNQFFYTLVYDPVHKSLQADRGEMRVGDRFQAHVKPFQKSELAACVDPNYRSEEMAELVWDPSNGLSDSEVESIIYTVKCLGTLARAIDFNNHSNRDIVSTSQMYSQSSKDPGLLYTACSASRDISTSFAYSQINKHKYNVTDVMLSLVDPAIQSNSVSSVVVDTSSNTPTLVLLRDEIEAWSVYEANLFEEALDKIGKDFNVMKDQIFPWKTLPAIIEYYYMWKATDRYMRQKRLKAADIDQRLKQVYIPSDGSVNNPNKTNATNRIICEGCETEEAESWFLWGQNNACRLCGVCWVYWKKYGGLIKPNFYEGNIISRSSSKAETFRYECRSCGKLFNRQERLINHMASHGQYTCTVGSCEKDFKSRNQLHRHLATIHRLVLTKKDTYVQAVKSRTCFILITTLLSKCSRQFCPFNIKTLARKPCVDFDHELCEKETTKNISLDGAIKQQGRKNLRRKESKLKTNHSAKLPSVNDDMISKIVLFNQNIKSGVVDSGALGPCSDRHTKRKLPSISLPICSAKVKRMNWIDQVDGYLYIQNDKTLKLRNLLPVPQQRKCGRRPSVLALPDMGRG